MNAIQKNLMIVLILVAIGANGATATDDAGVRSDFARGAGERALALGGAYGGLSGDANSIFWNPAGLADVSRYTFTAAHTNLISMGFQEQTGVLALPSWRLGTIALALRRHGVDGIEGRDDRGTLYADDLQDSQSELALGYARQLGQAWRVGASFKMQRHELAGESGSGLGLDAGFQLHPGLALGRTSDWAQGLSLGLTFRNIVEPTIRLINDDVRDPGSVRFGTALQRPVSQHLDLLLALDIEKTKDMDSRLHAGAEVVLMDVLALRAGSHNGMLTAGLGARWDGLKVDYTFEDNILESVHRFGVGVAFGATTTQRRQAAHDRQDAELNAMLADAFASEDQQRNARTVATVRAALANEDYAGALEKVRALNVIAPDHPQAAHLIAAAHFGLGQRAEKVDDLAGAAVSYQACLRRNADHPEASRRLAAVIAESEHRFQRAEDIRQLYRQAMTAFGAGNLESARAHFAQALALAPEDGEIQDLLRHVDDAIRIRDEASAAQAAAERSISARASEVAVAESQTVPKSDVGSEVSVPALNAPSYGALSVARQSEIADLYTQGQAAAAAGRRNDAVRYWELVAAVAPDYQQVSDHLEQEYLAQGLEAFAAGRLDRAIEIWGSALALDPDNARTRGYLARAHKHRARIRTIRSGE